MKKKLLLVCFIVIALLNFIIFIMPAKAEQLFCYGKHDVVCPACGVATMRCDCQCGEVCFVSDQIPCVTVCGGE